MPGSHTFVFRTARPTLLTAAVRWLARLVPTFGGFSGPRTFSSLKKNTVGCRPEPLAPPLPSPFSPFSPVDGSCLLTGEFGLGCRDLLRTAGHRLDIAVLGLLPNSELRLTRPARTNAKQNERHGDISLMWIPRDSSPRRCPPVENR